MNVPLTKVFYYLFNPNKKVDIKYFEHDVSGDIRTTSFLTPKVAEKLDDSNKETLNNFIKDIDVEVKKSLRQESFFRYLSAALLLIVIIMPTLVLSFLGAGYVTVIFGIFYAFFTYIAVEGYIQANRNYFEDELYKRFKNQYL